MTAITSANNQGCIGLSLPAAHHVCALLHHPCAVQVLQQKRTVHNAQVCTSDSKQPLWTIKHGCVLQQLHQPLSGKHNRLTTCKQEHQSGKPACVQQPQRLQPEVKPE
jgi:hypothetical protein